MGSTDKRQEIAGKLVAMRKLSVVLDFEGSMEDEFWKAVGKKG
jgi:hypothetical protein